MQRNVDYIPMTASEAIGARLVVKQDPSADYAAKIAVASTAQMIGVNSQLAKASGEVADIITEGIAEVICGASVTRGDFVTADSAGKVTPLTVAMYEAAKSFYIGIALESGSTSDIITIIVQPGIVSKDTHA